MKPYKEYKDSGIPWIGAIPKDWEVKKLKFLTSVNDDVLSENTISEYSFRYVDIGSVSLDKGIELYQKMVFEDCPSRARRIVKKGDIIISTVRTYLKAIAEITDDNDVVVSTGFAVIRAKNIFDKYLKYVLLNSYFVDTVASLSVGVSYPAINTSTMMNIKITIPTFDTQRRIADYLDHKTAAIDTLIDDKQKMIELLKERRQAIISEAVTKGLDKNAKMKDSGVPWIGEIPEDWEVNRLKYCFTFHQGGAWGEEAANNKNDRICIRVADFNYQNLTVKNSDQYTIRNYSEKQINNLTIHTGDLLIEKSGGGEHSPVGRVVIYNKGFNALCANFIELLRVKNNHNSNFLNYLFSMMYSMKINKKYFNQTTGIQNLNITAYLNEKISLPPLDIQHRIAEYLDKKTVEIDNLITDITTQIEKLKEYRQAIISESVTGKVEI
ncbi:hypothetical protein FMM68_03385 [Lachnospiraceae bacterium MD329]|nr:hypothetical protein [Lachnospiraceae bacterium MD329]